ncbi:MULTISPECIES: hypothetical protein [unclassified Gilliamella]|uniref:hypothetical protein n=1 Tax=unclassified Gilliamella TaxID=2685620 RepID=UPI0013249AE6|nr:MULTISPECIES: hypothetical protein [unclassified Gilliamella]MWN06341.1 hypothetical protein [Gilliamella sp. Pas-s95]NUF27467.1 hypothetical protein [Gilliamella sp. ESL0254]
MVALIYILFYFFSIIPLIISYRFKKYSIRDYRYDNGLKWKKRIVLILNYAVILMLIIILGEKKTIRGYSSEFDLLLLSAGIFIYIYLFAIGWLESPRPFRKKKKWK